MNPERRLKGLARARRIADSWIRQGEALPVENCRRLVSTPTPCSCRMCGNPRKYFGELTIQERKVMDDFNEQMKDVA